MVEVGNTGLVVMAVIAIALTGLGLYRGGTWFFFVSSISWLGLGVVSEEPWIMICSVLMAMVCMAFFIMRGDR